MTSPFEALNSKSEPFDRLITIAEVATLLGLSRTSVYRLIWKGDLRVYRPVPAAPRLRLSEVSALLERSRT